VRAQLARSPDPSLETLLAELEGYFPALPDEVDVLGFAVPLELASADGDLRLITTPHVVLHRRRRDARRAELSLEASAAALGAET
jgi:hypothetical protein